MADRNRRRSDRFWVRWAPLLAFLALALAGGYAISQNAHQDDVRLRDAQVRSCERVNRVRQTLDAFLSSAANARQATGDPAVAQEYRELVRYLRNTPFAMKGTARVDCEEAFPEP